MHNIVSIAEDQVRQAVLRAAGEAVAAGELPAEPMPAFVVEVPGDRAHGDFAVNAALASAKAFRRSPRQIADALCKHLDLTGTFLQKAEVAGPGFLNFFLSPSYYAAAVEAVLTDGDDYGRSDFGQGKKVLVEFVSANPTGPMHIGNARGGALGDCLASVLDWAGYQVRREFYINDAGNQIEKFGRSLEARYLQLYREGIEMPEEAYLGQDIVDHAKAFAEQEGDRFVDVPSEERRKALVDYALPLNIAGLERDLAAYRIRYDRWFRESALHENGEARQVVRLLTEKGFTYERDGAVWFKAADLGADKDFVLVRSNGLLTYVVPDIAYHYNKLVTRGFDLAVDVLGADHHGYVPRLKAALQALGVDPNRLQVVLMQMVRLIRDGEVVKASKRSGKAITLVTLLEEIPIDAARFYFNLREANTQLDFDLDLAVEQSASNPVYYVQYAHARICSIFRNLAGEGMKPRICTAEELEALSSPEERDLIRFLAAFPGEIVAAAREFDPSRITRYTLDLAGLFHKFYNACRVKGEAEPLLQARLALCAAVRTVLGNALRLMKIDAPESM